MDLVISKIRGVYMNAKIINLDDSDLENTVDNSYIFLVKVDMTCFTV